MNRPSWLKTTPRGGWMFSRKAAVILFLLVAPFIAAAPASSQQAPQPQQAARAGEQATAPGFPATPESALFPGEEGTRTTTQSIFSLFQNPPIESQPAEFAIKEPRGAGHIAVDHLWFGEISL